MRLEVISLALTASVFTALASVAQRSAAARAPAESGPSLHLIGYLLRRPVWLIGIASMILGFVFQVAALRVGTLSLVQPVIAAELLIVFGIIALRSRHRVRMRDWLAALGLAASLGAFLTLARPSGGHAHASAWAWGLAGIATLGVAAALTVLAYACGGNSTYSGSSRKAALLAMAAATGFGFVAAVIKELSTHLAQGPSGIFSNWSPYILVVSGVASMYLASHAFQAGPLAASQPGFTIVDPLVASALGVVLFGERMDFAPLTLAGEMVALIVLVASVVLLSHSPLVRAERHSVLPPIVGESTKEAVEMSDSMQSGRGDVLSSEASEAEQSIASLVVYLHHRGQSCVASFNGALTVATRATIEGVANVIAGENEVLLDFSRVDGVDEVGLDAVEMLVGWLRRCGGHVRMTPLTGRVHDSLPWQIDRLLTPPIAAGQNPVPQLSDHPESVSPATELAVFPRGEQVASPGLVRGR
jgi:drug/metabolite transporter (DMT)-like permease